MNRFCLAVFLLLGVVSNALSQSDTTTSNSVVTLTGVQSIDSLFIFNDSIKTSAVQTKSFGSILSQVINKAQQHSVELGTIKLDLSEFLDTAEMSRELPGIHLLAERVKEQTIMDSTHLNQRYLKGMENLVERSNEVNQSFQKTIQTRIAQLTVVGDKLAEIKSDSVFTLTLRDSTLVPEINKELTILKADLKTVDSIYLAQEIMTAGFQARISENAMLILELKQYLDSNKKRLDRQYWTKEINYPWESKTFVKDSGLSKTLRESLKINLQFLNIYVKSSLYMGVFSLIILGFLYYKLRSAIKSISTEKEYAALILERVKYFEANTTASTILIVLPIFLAIFQNPPLIFISLLSLVMVIASTFLIKLQFGKYFYKLWRIFIIPYILLEVSALNWKVVFQERWYILISSLLFIVMGVLVFNSFKKKHTPDAKFLQYLAIFLIVIETFAFMANMLGRFNLAKTYSITGVILFYRGVGLYLFVNVFLGVIYLLIEFSKKEKDEFTSYFDFKDLQKRMKGFLYVFAAGIWLYGLFWHLGYYDDIYDWIVEFLSKDRTLGNTVFQYGSILLLVIIIYISTFLANTIAYFATIKDQKIGLSRKKRLGSSVLLIRLGVLTIGFFIGMTAAKIPLDKIAIVLGALSVGIGFGLQTIINNLVSGVILAFERPIQIGDEIQVGQNSGTVKEVGIRASKIQAYDGSEIVIPNGDLLSQSLINWTLSDKRRRIELVIGVGYPSDMKLVKSIIEGILAGESILKIPSPKVYMQTFNQNSVDFRVLFWVENIDIWVDLRAEVMTHIFEKFAENNIELPFPKRDIYIKSMPPNWQETVSKPNEMLDMRENPSDINPPETETEKKSPEN
jgi:small-conductance mechanosensitive channel